MVGKQIYERYIVLYMLPKGLISVINCENSILYQIASSPSEVAYISSFVIECVLCVDTRKHIGEVAITEQGLQVMLFRIRDL